MKKGEIAAIIHVVGKPNSLFTASKPEPGYKFLPLEFSEKFEDYYVPAELTNADYPNLIPKGETVQTISVTALLAVFNWNANTNNDRYRRSVRFIEYLFERFDKLRQPPYQPKWKEMNIAGTNSRMDPVSAGAGADRQGYGQGDRQPRRSIVGADPGGTCGAARSG